MADDESTHIGRDANVNDGDFVAGNKTIINQADPIAEEFILARLAEIDARWSRMLERHSRLEFAERDVDDCIRFIDQMDEIRLYDPEKYISRLNELRAKIDGDRADPDNPWVLAKVKEHFEQYIRRNNLGFLTLFTRLISVTDLFDTDPRQAARRLAEIGSRTEISVAIEWAIADSELPHEYKLRAVSFLESTYRLVDYEYSKEYLEQLVWSSLLHSWSTISFWRQRQSFIRSRTLKIGENAFVSKSAEGDPFLFPPGQTDSGWTTYTSQPPKLRPGWYKELRHRMQDPRPVYVVGDRGFGKTAAALMLAWDELLARPGGRYLPSSTLPVYSPYRIAPSSDSFLKQYALAYAKTLMGYLAATPYEFLQAPSNQQSAMAMLLVCCLGSVHELRAQFSQHRMRRIPMPARFFEVLKRNVTGISPVSLNLTTIDTDRLLSLLLDATPHSVIRRIPLVDIQASDLVDGRFTPLIDTLIPTLERLAANGIGSTVFVPRNLISQISSPENTFFPAWTYDEIVYLLENRLSAVTRTPQYDISVFCDFREVDSIDDIQKQLIERSHMLPGRLIEIVQRFISRIERTNTLLNQREIDEIFDSFS